MVKTSALLLATLALSLTACASYNIGSEHDTGPNGSYAGSTLNSPVTDQNPHVGGDASYPSGDTGKPLAPSDKLDGR